MGYQKERKDEKMGMGFPRTMVGGVSLPRMIVGTNWFMGFSHTTRAADNYIKKMMGRKEIADVLEVFLRAGVDAVMGQMKVDLLRTAIEEAEQRTGLGTIRVSTPTFAVTGKTAAEGFEKGEVERTLDGEVKWGSRFVMPHAGTTDAMVDLSTREIRQMGPVCAMIREREMVPGLSTHMPETIVYADETGLDVETYISIYNLQGFLMHEEVDWTAKVIAEAKKPVMTIKPMAAGRVPPFQGLTFVWNSIRVQDMVTVGTLSAGEAAECIEMSLGILEGRGSKVELQETRSKAAIKPMKR
jgi:hypothetical protein